MPDESAASFLANIQSVIADFQSLEVRVLAQEGDDGLLYLRGLHAVFRHEAPDKVLPVEGPNGDGFWSRQVILRPSEVANLLEEAGTGSLHIDGRTLIFQERDNRVPSLTYFFQGRLEGTTTPPMGVHIIGTGTDMGRVPSRVRFERLEAILRGLQPPWDGWIDVSLNFLGFRPGGISLEQHRPAGLAFQIEAPIGVHLETARVAGNHVEIGLSVDMNVDVSAIQLAMFARYMSHIERTLIPVPPRKPGMPFTINIPLKTGIHHVTFAATYRGWEAGRLGVRIPGSHVENPRVAQLRQVLKVYDVVNEGLLDEGTRGRDLEPWLTLLLYQLGLQVAPTDKPGNKTGAVDFLAMLPNNDTVLLVELTEDAPDNRDKMRKLAVRASQFVDQTMQDAFPVLVTRLPSVNIPESDRQMAGREGIALICREDLVHLGLMAEENRMGTELLPFLESRVPPNPDSDSPIGMRRRGPFAYL